VAVPEFRYDERTALIVVDVQNDFADPKGGLYVSGGEDIVPVVNDEIAAATAAGAPVFYTQDWHPPTTPHFLKDGGVWPVHCVRDTWGAELHPALRVEGPVVRKGTEGEDGYSGFSVRDPVSGAESATRLGALLDRAEVSRTVVVGLAGDVCVKATALDARRLGYDVTVPLRATRFVELVAGDGERAVTELRDAGVAVD
jgi:nicotinamidase/pyrazinamidase